MERPAAEAYIFGSIMLLANKLQIWGDGVIEGMTMKQFFLLILISKMEKRNPTITEAADFSGTSRQNVKNMLGPLQAKGFVKIGKSETDARALGVSLSEKTYEYFAANDKKSSDALNGLFSEISDDDLGATIRTLEKLLITLGHPPLEALK